MRAFILAACLVACGGPADELETTETSSQTIRNGTREPQVVMLDEGQTLALGWLHPAGSPGRNFCTGTLVTPRVVATAKHCVEGRSGRNVAFGIGLLPAEPRATFAVAQVFAHPELDAAMLLLESPATDTVPELVPIPYNRAPIEQALVGTEVEAAGYGETYDRSRFGRYFAVVELIGFDRTQVHVDGRGEQGICFGDSGGPVMTAAITGEPVVLGVESWGDQSCLGVDHLTRLDIIADWIEAIDSGTPPETECGDLDYRGRCDEATATWCENGQLRDRDCAARGQVCEFVDDETGFFCADAPPCGEIDSRGSCEGHTVVRCRFDELRYEDCAADGKVCGSDASGAFCAPPPEPMLPDEPEPEDPAPVDPPPDDPAPEDPGVTLDAPVSEAPGTPTDEDGAEKRAKSAGCSAAPGGSGHVPWGLALLLVAPALRRRRVRRSPSECTRSSPWSSLCCCSRPRPARPSRGAPFPSTRR